MRYAALCLTLAALLFFVPLEKRAQGAPKPDIAATIFTPQEQEAGIAWLDARVDRLRAMPPMQQALAMGMAMVLMVCIACVIAYLINSLAAVAGMGISVLEALLAGMAALLARAVGWKAPAAHFKQRMRRHAEFGPFASRLQTRQWRRRFRLAARKHGFAGEY